MLRNCERDIDVVQPQLEYAAPDQLRRRRGLIHTRDDTGLFVSRYRESPLSRQLPSPGKDWREGVQSRHGAHGQDQEVAGDGEKEDLTSSRFKGVSW